MAKTREDYIELCRRLRALSTSSNPNEAAAASAKLLELTMAHQISLIELDAAEDQHKKILFSTTYVNIPDPKLAFWQAPLIRAIGKAFGVRVIGLNHNPIRPDQFQSRDRYGNRLNFDLLGEPHMIETVQYLFDYLTFSIDQMSNVHWMIKCATSDIEWGKRGSKKFEQDWRDDFKSGAVTTISTRLAEMGAQIQREQSASTMALIVVRENDLKEFVTEKYPDLVYRSDRHRVTRTSDGFGAGQKYGREADLGRRGIVGSGPVKRLN